MLRPETTFCDVPFATFDALDADVAILGAPHGTPYRPGEPSHAAGAPAALRAALGWYDTRRDHIDMDHGGPLLGKVVAVDAGDVPGDPDDDGSANCAAIRAAAGRCCVCCLNRGPVPSCAPRWVGWRRRACA